MNITVTVEICNDVFESFPQLEEAAHQIGLKVGRSIMKYCLEKEDKKLMGERDSERFRDKGLRSTCIKTKCGSVEYSRRVYRDLFAKEGDNKCVYLLDQKLDVQKIGTFTSGFCRLVASSVCESTYRKAARQITEQTGQEISAQGVWNIIQKLGEMQKERAEQNAELAKESQGKGTVETQILYEEDDGIWLHLQGESRKTHGRSKEMKVGIAYDGVLWKENKEGKKRRILNNKIAYAEFGSAKEYLEKKEGLIASKYDVDAIELRVVNGDGAAWTKRKKEENVIAVLDEYHRNKKITECIKDPTIETNIREYLYSGDIDTLMDYIEAATNSIDDEKETEGLQKLYKYYDENREALKDYYDRGIEIPPTRNPGELHHARLGSMESNIFTLIGNRMKGRRFNWSIKGADNLASILCAYHTTGMEALFAELPGEPEIEKWIDEGKPLAAKDNKIFAGKGYEYPASVSTQASPYWLRDIAKMNGFSDLKLRF